MYENESGNEVQNEALSSTVELVELETLQKVQRI